MDTDTEQGARPIAPEPDFTTSVEVNELFAALAKAQGEIGNAEKSRENPAFKSKYATLADCLDACRGPLAKSGLCLLQPVRTDEYGVVVTTLLGHSSGQWLRCSLLMPLTTFTAHTIGSAITYGRRYGLCAVVGVAPDDDDDGNSAVQGQPAQRQQSPRASQQEPAKAAMSSADKDRADKALKGLLAARKASGMAALASPAAVIADLMGPDFRIVDGKTAADFASCVAFEIERIEMQGRVPA